jgi:dipeptidyl aminopeptidase/acylaminoacyl peptidase
MKRCAFVLVCVVLLSPGRAEPPGPAEKPVKAPAAAGEKWTIDDIVNTESAHGFQFSPDGRWVVWVKTVADKDKGERVSQLVRTELAANQDTELTRGPDSCTNPRWSPDGKRLAFLSTRPAPKSKPDDKPKGDDDEPRAQLWLIDPFGGEPWPLTEFPRGVAAYDWAGGDALVFAAQEEPTYRENTLKEEKKDTAVVVEDEKREPPARLFRVAVKTKKVARLTDNSDRIESVAVAPDGRRAVTIHNRSLRFLYDNKVKPAVFLTDLETGERRQVFADPQFNVSQVRWAPDGKGFYATDEHNSQPQFVQASVTELYYYDLANDEAKQIDLGWERGLAAQTENDSAPGFVPTADGFLALLADGVRNRAARYTRAGDAWKREWLTGEHAGNLFGLQATAEGKAVAYAHSTASSPTQWYHARLDGNRLDKPVACAPLNETFQKRTPAKTEVVRWKGALDEEVEGILYYPRDHKPGERRPLVVMIHGGPASADLDAWEDRWSYPANLVCQRGAFVLKPNYHGSSGYGLKWLESITQGKYCEPELIDVEKGVDALVARGLVDPAKLGLLGWSNGAILTNQLITRTTRYKAAVVGAGNVEYVSDWASCEFGDAFDRYYLGASPLEDPELYLKKSPFFRLDRVRTPTLIFHGTEDRVVGTQQSWVQYRAMQQLGRAEVRFVLFPGEKHSLKKLAHQRRKLEEELAWFDRHLFGSVKEEDESLKADSPLAWALKKKAARRDGNRFGVVEKGRLIPETVKHGELCVGRFEVTRAQFAQFDPAYPAEPGRENYPASGVTFEQARDYCAWLSKLTGRTYRLPTEGEAEELYDKPEPGENTLDHWAGYAVNPDDAARLREKVRELGGQAPLLREVGSGRGAGEEELVFDLGGNVAEWVTTREGKGEPRGGSADQPADAKRGPSRAAPEYRGFRVVLEEK